MNQLANAIYNFNKTHDETSLVDLKENHVNFGMLISFLLSLAPKAVGEPLEGEEPLIEWF